MTTQPDTLTKEQAAEHLGVSVRTFQRLVARKIEAGKYKAQYDRGKTGQKVAVYERATLDEWKAEPEEEVEIAPGTTGMSNRATSPLSHPDTPAEGQALARRVDSSQLVEMFAKLIEGRNGHAAAPSISDLAHKLFLTEREAATYSGLPLSTIRSARVKLKTAKRGGRSFLVRRDLLEAWAKRL